MNHEYLREQIAMHLQSAKRHEVLADMIVMRRSASMSQIEYFPPWEKADAFLRKPWLEKADELLSDPVSMERWTQIVGNP